MKPKPARRDVAKAAGVSEAVVSYVLNGKARANRISEATEERVRVVAAELGYQPSAYARALKTRKSGLLALISQDLTDPNTAEIIKALGQAVRKRGYGLLLMDLASQQELASDDLNAIETGFAEGLFLHLPSEDLLALCSRKQLLDKPVCVIGKQVSGADVPFVEVDNLEGARLAAAHLLQVGAERIGIIADVQSFRYTQERIQGCESVLAAHPNCSAQIVYRSPEHGQFEAGVAAVQQWQRLNAMPDGIFAMGDVLAIGALHTLQDLGFACPQDVKVVGFDGIPFARYTTPPLTTIVQPFAEMCEQALEILASALGDGPKAKTKTLLAPRLAIRASTGCIEEREGECHDS